MSVSAIDYTSASYSSGASSSDRLPKQSLGQEDFLKLLTLQLTKQDPMKPMEDTSFMAQMAQFTSLEQSSQMAQDMAAMRAEFSQQSAYAMIGKNVTVDTGDGQTSGLVDSVESTADGLRIRVGGELYSLSQVQRVAPPAPASESQT